MSRQSLNATLSELGIPSFVDQVRHASLARQLAAEPSSSTEQPRPQRLPRLAYVYETAGLASFQRWIAKRGSEDLAAVRSEFRNAFDCWRALVSLPDASVDAGGVSCAGLRLITEEVGGEPIPADLQLAFHLSVTGLLGECTAETRLELQQFQLTSNIHAPWRDAVARHVFSAFALLVRKAGGWKDIDEALRSITELRTLQQQYEDQYIDGQGPESSKTLAAIELVGLYHLAQLVTIVGEYLATGKETAAQVNLRIDRHHDRARGAFDAAKLAVLGHLADLFWLGCRELVQNCIWTHVGSLPESVRQFAKVLTSRGRPAPVIELWPSQQEALRRNLLDTYPRAILVEMPTSAGKTLLAKFAIVQTKSLNPTGTIVYIVPTRALVNQITLDLREDFRELQQRIRVEQTVPAFELDPTEKRLLENAPDVLVTTPEKLDLLIRADHPSVKVVTLVIADEAHNIGAKGRGARLELLLGTLKRDRGTARFLLLSPFLPNDQELLTWLGEERALPPIQVDWKPSRRMVGAVSAPKKKNQHRKLTFTTLAAVDNADVPEGLQIILGEAPETVTPIAGISAATVKALLPRGSILILCRGQGTAVTRAKELAKELPERASTPLLESVCKYLEAEIGREPPLVSCLRKGVAYHHAGMSQEAKWLVEGLIRRGLVNVVCGTTTLAQGLNFPITTVIMETLDKGDEPLTYQDFWNIAGRAGRTLVDTLGVIAFPASKLDEFTEFLKGEATEISSQLARLIDRADEIGEKFNLYTVKTLPELSALLQFLAHAMRVSGSENVADEVEDLLRASLIYHQANRSGPDAAKKLIDLCRSYLVQIQGRKDILALADTTGFATPSVFRLLQEKTFHREFTQVDDWNPDRLFGQNIIPLRDRVAAIADLPEMQLGQGGRGPFSANLVASILRDWVQGETLDVLAKRHSQSTETDPDKKLSEFSSYLFSRLLSRASWGIGALEGLCLAGQEAGWEEVGHVPSMIFFGVRRKEAVWFRMVGAPRIVAGGLADVWTARGLKEPKSYDDIRDWVSGLSDDEWGRAIPKQSKLTAGDMRLLWREFNG